jgi:ATP-dependent DNA helicase DinG
VDARMAKDSYQYVCDSKVDDNKTMIESLAEDLDREINEWLGNTKRGERSEIPQVPDHIWNYIGWDDGMACDLCLDRGFCKLIRAKEYYKAAKDLIVVDHDLFFKDLWTRDELIREGKPPILPAYSAVIFDEGHKIILPAAMQAGQKIRKEEIEEMVHNIEQVHGVREVLLKTVAHLEEVTISFFQKLNQVAIFDEQSERYAIPYDSPLSEQAKTFQKVLDQLLLEFQIEQELYLEALPLNMIHAYEMLIDKSMMALHNFRKNDGKDMLAWINRNDGSFWVVPKDTNARLDKHLYQKKLPVVLTSATLSNDGDFSYLIRTLGLNNPTHSTVGNSFEMEKQVEVYLADYSRTEVQYADKIEKLVYLINQNLGRALVLANSKKEVQRIRKSLKQQQFPFELLWEDKAERGYLIRRFKDDISSVLIGYDLWEGIDVPGEALTMVIVWQLPFPALDPLIEEQRRVAKDANLDPVMTVDYPEMGLKLKQGCGRLIRTKDDQGKIVIMDSIYQKPYEKVVLGALPEEVMIKDLTKL